MLAEVIPIAAAIFYLLLLAWDAAALEANFRWLFELAPRQDQSQDQGSNRYNPMEPSHAGNGPNRSSGWLARP
jgi:hypothetical protein